MYYDLHAHILPNVDDGPIELDDSVQMARIAADHGTETILATPHRKDVTEKHSVEYVRSLVDNFNSILENQCINLKLVLGMENHLDLDLPKALETGHALTINSTQYALIEMPFFGHPNYIEEVLFQVQLQGITPVLAHPERIEAIQLNPDLLAGFVERGMISQVTAGSAVGHFGGKVKRLTLSLLRKGLVHVLASDTHFPSGPRSPILEDGLIVAESVVGKERATAMVTSTPKAILSGETVDLDPPILDRDKRRWWEIRLN